jgi:hypothetical protein
MNKNGLLKSTQDYCTELLPFQQGYYYVINDFHVVETAQLTVFLYLTDGKHVGGANFEMNSDFHSKFVKLIYLASGLNQFIPGNILNPLRVDSLFIISNITANLLYHMDYSLVKTNPIKQLRSRGE